MIVHPSQKAFHPINATQLQDLYYSKTKCIEELKVRLTTILNSKGELLKDIKYSKITKGHLKLWRINNT